MWAFGAYDGGSNPPGTTSASDSEQSSLDADSKQGAALLRPWFESARDYFAASNIVSGNYPQRIRYPEGERSEPSRFESARDYFCER